MKKFRLSGSCVGNPTAPASLKHLSSMYLTSSAERPSQVSSQAGQQPMNRLRITYESLKNHLRFAAAFLLLLCLGVGNAWGDDSYTITFGNNVNSANGLTASTCASTVISSGTGYVVTSPFTVNSGNIYYGDTKTCIAWGNQEMHLL